MEMKKIDQAAGGAEVGVEAGEDCQEAGEDCLEAVETDKADLIQDNDERNLSLVYGGLEYEELSSCNLEEMTCVEWRTRAEEELQEKSEWRERDIQALRDLVEAEEGLVCDTSDAFLIKFLRAKKFDYESSFRMLQRYLGLRARSPGNFAKSLPSQTGSIFEQQLQHVLPHRDHMARRVFMFRAGKWDTGLLNAQVIMILYKIKHI
ncbi:alpha-tocopherol transfer protein-like [Eurytemora carolleeae]|uniref:alpha-tocopherol transfer protein-like n=1 Tax=Eurytemora carolleeae TaxID=1294199 RepID=UPI000C787C3B|nr:alpha-tocopherol transfer protein-like [Eurytemora carolleeae]|eukprot:XP_023349007.1 alpha-tocopherol transfer protein-like [Eurytemora affinis]